MKKILCIAILAISCPVNCVVPYYSIRSQGQNTARELVGAGWNTQINLCDSDKWNGIFSIIPEYTKSFRPYYISRCLFGSWNCCSTYCSSCPRACNPCYNDNLTFIRINGSQVETRCPCDWLADYFGLPTDYKSCITFEPYIENFLVDFNFSIGFDPWCKGLYFRIHAPVSHTRWDLNFCECIENQGICEYIENKGCNAHWPGYFSDTVVTNSIGILRTNLVDTFEAFINGCDIIKDSNICFNPLCYARISRYRLTKTGLADIQMALGWNVLCNEDYHFGINGRATAPTGNRPMACYLFEPIVGNGKHWELGCRLTTHWTFWRSTDNEEALAFYLDANVTHLFKTRQCRTFDLCYKPLSRYILAAKFGPYVNDLKAGPTAGQATAPSHQFLGIYAPVANLTTLAVDVSIGAQADIAFLLQYTTGNCSFDLGYNFWGKTCEKIECTCTCPCPFEENTWALKGDAFMYGFLEDSSTGTLATPGIALSSSQSKATICKGANNWPDSIGGIAWSQNPGIDNKQLAWDNNNNPLLTYDVATTETRQVYTSKDPVFISFCDIDMYSTRTKGMSHKIFTHFDYTCHNNDDWVPYIGIGGEIEFGHHNDNACSLPCNSECYPCEQCTCDNNFCHYPCGSCSEQSNCNPSCCTYCAISQWGIWLKGGVAFN